MERTKHSDMLVCKICEVQVDAKILEKHSFACKDAAELKEKVIEYQSELSTLVSKAYDFRNQLNTNFVIEKYVNTI